MSVESILDPSDKDVIEGIETGISNQQVILILGDCEVEYTGRAEGYLGPGERVTIVKPDGTLLVHRSTGHDPVNWQPPGSNLQVLSSDQFPGIEARRSDPVEVVKVYFLEVFSITTFEASDTAPLELSGTEADMHAYVSENPSIIEDGLRIIEHERDTKHGAIDFFARDSTGRPVLIEIKRRRATHTHVDQLRRYVDLYKESNQDIRGILVAPTASENVQRELREYDLEFVSLESTVTAGSTVTSTTFDDFRD